MRVPFMVTRPSEGSSSSARQRSSVVLPEPLGPTTHTTSRSATASDTRLRTWLRPNRFETPSAAMIGARAIDCPFVAARRVGPPLPYNQPLCLSWSACRRRPQLLPNTVAFLTYRRDLIALGTFASLRLSG